MVEFKTKYLNKASLKITDIGFEDYYLIHDLLCHRIKIDNPERYYVREAIKWCFLNAIYDNGRVNSVAGLYSTEFVKWLCDFDKIFTTNYDANIEVATGCNVYHLHGNFVTRKAVYRPDSFRNKLPDHPAENCAIDENYAHLYSTAISTYSGDYKQYFMQEGELANAAVEKMAVAYEENQTVHDDIDSWIDDRNELVARMHDSILLKVENPDLRFDEPYPIQPLRDMAGELTILGLSPYNDRHLFKIINESKIEKCLLYYYDQSETDIISTLLPNIIVAFDDVSEFWHTSTENKPSAKKGTKRIAFKYVSRTDFHKFSDCYRALSKSIMNDNDIVRQFNRIPYHIRTRVCSRIKTLQVEREREVDQQFVLSVVDIHIIAGEFNIDPAVVCCVGTDNCKNEFIRFK